MRMKVSPTQSLGLYEIKQHIPCFHEKYLQLLVQRKQANIQLFTGSQPKKCRDLNIERH